MEAKISIELKELHGHQSYDIKCDRGVGRYWSGYTENRSRFYEDLAEVLKEHLVPMATTDDCPGEKALAGFMIICAGLIGAFVISGIILEIWKIL